MKLRSLIYWRHNFLIGLSILIFLPLLSRAQVDFNGTLDLSVAKGGKESKFITNEINNEYRNLHMSIYQLNLFAFAQVTDDFFVNARIQWDIWGTGKLNAARITLAMIGWEPEESNWSLGIGRFVSPFGLYPRRILSADNLFTQAPLGYGYFINMSDERGYWPKAGDSGIYGPNDVGLTTVYFGGYSTGFLASLDHYTGFIQYRSRANKRSHHITERLYKSGKHGGNYSLWFSAIHLLAARHFSKLW